MNNCSNWQAPILEQASCIYVDFTLAVRAGIVPVSGGFLQLLNDYKFIIVVHFFVYGMSRIKLSKQIIS